MKIAIGGDHAGFPMKEPIFDYLASQGHEVTDFGTLTGEPVDFPDISRTVCDEVRQGRAERGILICGTGVGAAIAGNKISGIRAAVAHDIYSAHQCVEHDDVNLLAIGAQIIGVNVAQEIVTAFLAATFSTDPDFRRRVAKLHDMEIAGAKELLGED
jgi:ribose 5-phosphate isomerase B